MAQVGGIIVTQMPISKDFVFAGINNVKFRKPVAGDQLIITCELLSIKRQRFEGKVRYKLMESWYVLEN